ncbi:MAG: ferredoxin [archaeon]
MAKYQITYDRDGCIGAAACAALDPARWNMNSDGKADMIKAKEIKPGLWVLEVDDLGDAKDAAESCPVSVIKIKNLDTGEDIV